MSQASVIGDTLECMWLSILAVSTNDALYFHKLSMLQYLQIQCSVVARKVPAKEGTGNVSSGLQRKKKQAIMLAMVAEV